MRRSDHDGLSDETLVFIKDREPYRGRLILAAHVLDAEDVSRLTNGAIVAQAVVRLERWEDRETAGHLAADGVLVDRQDFGIARRMVDDEGLARVRPHDARVLAAALAWPVVVEIRGHQHDVLKLEPVRTSPVCTAVLGGRTQERGVERTAVRPGTIKDVEECNFACRRHRRTGKRESDMTIYFTTPDTETKGLCLKQRL
jgi:hypothetical protein